MANDLEDPSSTLSAPRSGKKMTDGELLNLIAMYEQASLGSEVAAGATISTTIFPNNQAMTTLEVDRYNALNAFFARPLGNEIENRSQVVMPVIRDTVNWMMPQLMRIFAGAKTICRFDPENQNDEAQAELETMVVNHVFMQQNNGILILHDFFWDAILMRNGYAEVYTKKETKVSEETYEGMDQIDLARVVNDDGVEVIEQREYMQEVRLPPMPGMPPGQTPPVVTQVPAWDIKIRKTATTKTICVTALPPEEMRVSPRARQGLEDTVFAMHMGTEARSDLITQGYDKEKVLAAVPGRPNWLEIDALARDQVVDQLSIENPSDFSMQEIELRKVVIKVDADGDDVAELRLIVIAGDQIVENSVIEETCFVSCEAMRMPHRHTGISVYDLVMDLQVIQSDLWRAGLTNLTIANNLRYAVDWRNVNIDDLLTSRPHGPIRGNGPPSNWIMPIQPPSNVTEQILPVLDYVDRLRSNRTGIGKGTMGLDSDELQNVTKGGQLASMSAASLILELIARLLAEGVKWIFLKIHSELMRHQDKPLEFKIAGKWVQVDPSQCRRRTKVSPNVGLGSGNREEMRANVQMLGAAQGALAQMGLVGPKQAYETFKVMCEALGFNNPERFAMDPQGQEFQQHMAAMAAQPHPQAPQVQVAQIRAQTEQAKQASEDQRQVLKVQSDLLKANKALLHEQHLTANSNLHDSIQQHLGREVQLDQNHLQIILKLIPAIAQILAAEKAAPDELGSDVTRAGSEIQ